MQQAYLKLHEAGYAHSIEVWEDKELVGGLYGIAMGKIFFGESMFSCRSNTSKIALVNTVQTLHANGYELIDCQVANPHLASLGARTIARSDFMRYLPGSADIPKPAYWPYNSTNTLPARILV